MSANHLSSPTAVRNGIDVLRAGDFSRLAGRSVAVLCNHASVASDGAHVLDLLLGAQRDGILNVRCALGPQHGIWGHTQDNMVEWEGYVDARTGLRFHSLYGDRREPLAEWFEGVDVLVADLVDIGSRYYTFTWTLVYCLRLAQRIGLHVVVLDRVNPINGVDVEGPLIQPGYASFVGLHSLPIRHGLTYGEICRYLQQTVYGSLSLDVVEVEGWSRASFFDETGLLWVLPSPNMPTPDTALVYPGGCLIEGTKLSEGRGTTRPFEIVGAPFIDAWSLAAAMNALELPGAWFRPHVFQPTNQKHAGRVCGGVQVHVADRRAFRPVRTYLALIHTVKRLWPEGFAWQDPPYEYELVRAPFDILAGNSWMRDMIDSGAPLDELVQRMDEETGQFQGRELVIS